MKCNILLCILILFFIGPITATAQTAVITTNEEAGLPFIQNFNPKIEGIDNQNWGILQDHRGVMYFGNNAGVLEYDGVSWRLIVTPNKSVVRSLAQDANGRIYVGARSEFGYLAPDSVGQLQYKSLLEHIAPDKRDFFDAWQTLASSHGIYFRTNKYLFRWQPDQQLAGNLETLLARGSEFGGTLNIWPAQTSFHVAFSVLDTIYIRQREIGLMKLTGDSLQLVPDGERFADERVYVMLPFRSPTTEKVGTEQGEGKKILVGSRRKGFFLYNGFTFDPFQTEADAFLFANQLYHGAALSDGTFALATIRGGVAIIDQQGRLRQIINTQVGLSEDITWFAYPEPGGTGGLWLALNSGLARVEIPSPLSLYSDKSGLKGNINAVVRHAGRLYAANSFGVNYLLPPSTPGDLPTFLPVDGFSLGVWSILSVDGDLLAATDRGVYQIKHDQAFQLNSLISLALYHSRYNPNVVLVGLQEGLAVLQKVDKQWRLIGRVEGVSEDIWTIVEEKPSILWLGTNNHGVLRLELDLSGLSGTQEKLIAAVEGYGREQNLPAGSVRVFFIKDRVIFATQKGLHRFEEQSRLFVPDSTFGIAFADSTSITYEIVEGRHGHVWIKSQEAGWLAEQQDGSYTWYTVPFKRIVDSGIVFDMYPDPVYEEAVWIGSPIGIIRFDSTITKNYTPDYPALVRRVAVRGDSMIFGGTDAALNPPMLTGIAPILKYADNALRFEYAAPSYDDLTQNRFQVFLEGFDSGWSGWTAETQKDYTNLTEGDYTFRVRAKNIYEHESSEDTFAFTILPPWYRAWWAYLNYLLLFSGIIVLVKRNRERKLLRQIEELEQVVSDRTLELSQKNDELHEMNTLKSRFFANISHEFRTPLTLILGQIESVLPEIRKKDNIEKLKMAFRNSKQLQRLINQLLDLSKFDAQQMILKVSEQNIVSFLRHLSGAFESLAKQQKIDLQFESSQENIPIFFEPDKIEKVMYNLLSNAFKFTGEGGSITVKVDVSIPNYTHSNAETSLPNEGTGELIIQVRDTGIGISSERLPHVFDRFYQVDSSTTREYEGTGIGLALTRELVQIHGGAISVESSEGLGTTFKVRLLLGSAHLKDEQIEKTDNGYLENIGQSAEKLDEISNIEQGLSNTELEISGIQHPEPGTGNIILIIEDNSDMRAYIRETMAGSYQVLEASNGEEGFTKAIEHVPDLIITDAMMPKVDGYAMTRMLRKDPATSHIPIIMLTAKAAETDKFEGLETGVDVFLTKPFSSQELQIRVRKLIELRQQLLIKVKQQPIITASEVMITSVEQQFLERLQNLVEENLSDENFQVEEVCRGIGMSRSQLQRKLSALMGCSPAYYLRRIRMERAKQLLEQNAGNITEIGFEVGYGSGSAFARAFREIFEQPPSAFMGKQKE